MASINSHLDVVRSYLGGVSDNEVRQALVDGAIIIFRALDLNVHFATRENNKTADFLINHVGNNFNRIVRWEVPSAADREVFPSEEPTVTLNNDHTIITAPEFSTDYPRPNWASAADDLRAVVSLFPAREAAELPDWFYQQYKLLWQAATMKLIQEFQPASIAAKGMVRNWSGHYVQMMNAEIERASPERRFPAPRSSIAPPFGGVVTAAYRNNVYGGRYGGRY